uniref:Uncharacterized protein n=1 Tax=Anguilla anguilla TaxID=7936 RepID=A0A0E9UG61_ANGAN
MCDSPLQRSATQDQFLYACGFETGSRGNARTVATKNPIQLASPAIFARTIRRVRREGLQRHSTTMGS